MGWRGKGDRDLFRSSILTSLLLNLPSEIYLSFNEYNCKQTRCDDTYRDRMWRCQEGGKRVVVGCHLQALGVSKKRVSAVFPTTKQLRSLLRTKPVYFPQSRMKCTHYGAQGGDRNKSSSANSRLWARPA